jgi:hypothetical protein
MISIGWYQVQRNLYRPNVEGIARWGLFLALASGLIVKTNQKQHCKRYEVSFCREQAAGATSSNQNKQYTRRLCSLLVLSTSAWSPNSSCQPVKSLGVMEKRWGWDRVSLLCLISTEIILTCRTRHRYVCRTDRSWPLRNKAMQPCHLRCKTPS